MYEDFVKNNSRAHFLQSEKWAAFKHPQKSYTLLSKNSSGKAAGSCLVFVLPTKLKGYNILYSPRGPIFDTPEALEDIKSQIKKIAKKENCFTFLCDPDSTELLSDFKTAKNSPFSHLFQPLSVFRVNVNKADGELMESFHSKARYSVRTALKSALVCKIEGKEKLPEFVRLLEETAKRDNFTARPLDYFEKMYETFGNDFKLFMVYLEEKAVAGSVLLAYGNKTWHLYAGSDDSARDLMPNFLMQWEMMRFSRDNGYPIYDMRGVAGEKDKATILEGLFRFKKRFGGDFLTFSGPFEWVLNPSKHFLYNMMYKIRRKLS